MNQLIHILLVDNNPIFLDAAAEYLRVQEEFGVIGAVGGAAEALASVNELQPDVILLDLNMPGLSGLDAIPLLRDAAPQAHIIILSLMPAETYRAEALSLGAHDFVSKASMTADLAPAIRRARNVKTDKDK